MQSFLICLAILHIWTTHQSAAQLCKVNPSSNQVHCMSVEHLDHQSDVCTKEQIPLTVACHSKLRAHLNCAYSKYYLFECFHTHRQNWTGYCGKCFEMETLTLLAIESAVRMYLKPPGSLCSGANVLKWKR